VARFTQLEEALQSEKSEIDAKHCVIKNSLALKKYARSVYLFNLQHANCGRIFRSDFDLLRNVSKLCSLTYMLSG